MKAKHAIAFETMGYAVVPGVFRAEEAARMGEECDRLKVEAERAGLDAPPAGVSYLTGEDTGRGRILRLMKGPSRRSEYLDRVRSDPRILEILRPLCGPDVKQVLNQISWKTPGSPSTAYGLHQDVRYRRPAEAFRDLGRSYVQLLIAVDAHHQENGCLKVCPGTHRRGDLRLNVTHSIPTIACDARDLLAVGIGPEALVDVVLEPGDVALWTAYTVHGSEENPSHADRRAYLNGYVRASHCDVGEWVFRAGRPIPVVSPAATA